MKKYKWNKEKFFANVGKLATGLIIYFTIEKIIIDLISYALAHSIYA